MEAGGSSLQTHRIGKWLGRGRLNRENRSSDTTSYHLFNVPWLFLGLCPMFLHPRNRSHAKTVTRAFALAINSPDMSSVTAGRNLTSKLLRVLLNREMCNVIFDVYCTRLVSRCLAEGCSEAFVTNGSMKNHMARVHQQQEKRYKVRLHFLVCYIWMSWIDPRLLFPVSVLPSGLSEGLQQEVPAEGPYVWTPTAFAISVSSYTFGANI